MIYQVWKAYSKGYSVLSEKLNEDESSQFRDRGYKLIHSFEAEDTKTAQEKFVAWAKESIPDVEVEKLDFSAIKLEN